MVVTYLGYSVRFLGKMSSKRVRKGLLPLKMLVRQAVCSSIITQVQPCLCNCSTLTNTDYRTQLNECLCLCKSVLLLSWTLAVAVPLVSPRGGSGQSFACPHMGVIKVRVVTIATTVVGPQMVRSGGR